MKYFYLRYPFRAYIVSFLLVLLIATPGLACFSIVAGKKAAADGYVMMAHNEDDDAPQIVNHHKIPRQHHPAGDKVRLRNGGELDQVEETWAYIWSEMPGMLFSDSFVNEWGVCVTSDNCPSREDQAEITDGGIGTMLRRLVAQRARTAREGVVLAGSLVERFGYIDSGRTYIISDPQEGWLFCVVKGKHWLAKRVPDDEVAMVANTYTIRVVDLADQEHILASKDIITYAIQRGWYDPQTDGAFDFAAAYANPEIAARPSNLGRLWQGFNYISTEPIEYGSTLPFSLPPRRKVKPGHIMQVLRHAAEGVPPAASTSPVCPPEGSCQICSNATQTSFVAQLRQDLPREIGIVYWTCLGPPDTSIFIPFPLGISAFPRGYTGQADRPEQTMFEAKVGAEFNADPMQAFWTFSNFRHKAKRMPEAALQRIRTEAGHLEEVALTLQPAIDQAALQLYRKNKRAASQLLTNYSYGVYLSSMEVMEKIITQQNRDSRN